jgi:outer membrane protein
LSILALSQLLEFPSPEGFSIVRPAFSTTPATSLAGVSPDAIYQEALAMKPEVQAEQLRLTASERSIKIAKAALYPTLNFSAGLQSNYYKTNGMQADPFATQMKNNFSQYIGLNLNVPIFTRFQARNSIRSARIDYDNQQLQLENVKKTLYKEIQQVYYNAVAANSKYHSSEAAAQSSKDAFTLVQAKYENGKATITEFNESKNNYLKAESNLVQARYELLYQNALLDFYRGRELDF